MFSKEKVMRIRLALLCGVAGLLLTAQFGCKSATTENTESNTDYKVRSTTGEKVDITTEERFVMGQDSSYMFSLEFKNPMIKVENGYYIDINGVLYYADENLKLMAICDKPNCMHANESGENLKNCKAYISTGYLNSVLQYYNNSLYFLSWYNLSDWSTFSNESSSVAYRLYNVDGSSYNKSLCDFYDAYDTQTMLIHRGYVYYIYNKKEIDDKAGRQEIKLTNYIERTSLETGEKEVLMISDTGDENWVSRSGHTEIMYTLSLNQVMT